jgi:iron(III) transport system ATP-binding protein
MTDVHVEGITANYGGAPVLHDLGLDVGSGEVVAVLGASGSGKTTLLRVLAGFLRPTSGEVRFGDRVVSSDSTWVPPEHRRVGIVPQEGALFPHLDVAGNVAFGLPRGSSARVEEMLEMVGMAGMGRRRPQELSGGQQQRVALARALAPEPDVLCLDEPFSALDASLRTRLRGEVREVLARTGTTTILVTHDQEEALSIADRVAVVRDGRVVQVDTPDDLYGHPVDLDTARFVGEAVELDAQVLADGIVSCALGQVRVQGAEAGAGSAVVVLRPEQLAVVAERPVGAEGGSVAAAGAPGRVRACSYHGHDSLLLVELEDGTEVPVRVPAGRGAHPGDRVRVVVGGTGLLFTHP